MTLIINNKSDVAEMLRGWVCLHPRRVARVGCDPDRYFSESVLQMVIGDSRLKLRNERGGC